MNGKGLEPARAREYYERGYWTPKTLLDRWNEAVETRGDREYVSDDRGARCTYAQMDALADAFAAYLEEAGIRQGEVVSFQITPRCEFLAVFYGCLKRGAIPAPLGMCFVGGELDELLEKLQSRLHVGIASYRCEDRVCGLLALKNLPRLCRLVLLDGEADGAERLEDILAAGKKPAAYATASSEDVALILCTSGTTKGSKPVLFTHNAIIFSEESFDRAYGLGPDDCMFMPAPLNHATGLHHGIVSPMLRGARLVLQERFDCKKAVALMRREKCSYSMGATPFIYDILKRLDESGEDLPDLRFYISGGAPVPRRLVQEAWKNHGLLVCECYGSTESVPHTGVRPDECLANDGGSAGRAMDGIEVRIVDKDRRPVPPGTVGEEASRGPNMFSGYLGLPALTDEALDADGWFYSGDLAVMDEAGNVKIVGRIKDIIVRGGENLNTNLINDNLEGCPGVADHAVIGMPDLRLGERICAFVVPAPGAAAVTKESVTAYLRASRVQKRLWPERVEIIGEIPRTASGKVRKPLLQEELARRMKGECSHER